MEQSIIMPKKGQYVKSENYERKIKLPFIIYANSENVLVPGDKGEQNPEEPYKNKYQKHIACSFGYKWVYVDDKFSKSFKTYLDEDTVYNFINSMIKERKYCSDVMSKEDNEGFKNSTKCWIWDNDYIDNDVKVRHHCHITGKYRGSAHRDCNINFKLNHEINILFHNLKKSWFSPYYARTRKIQP